MIKKFYLLFLLVFSLIKLDAQVSIFSEDWSSSSFNTNGWTFSPSQSNWQIGSLSTPIVGATAPWASYNWTPTVTNYSYVMTSPVINATNYNSGPVRLSYLLFLDFFNTTTIEQFAVEYKATSSSTWTTSKLVNNAGGANLNLNVQNDTLFAMAGQNFQIRFRVFGLNSFNIDGWSLDNISVTAFPSPPCSGTPTAGTIVASSLTPCFGSTTSFSLTGASQSSGLSYTWERANSCTAPLWVTVSSPPSSSSVYSAVVPGTKAYRCIVTCVSSGFSSTTAPICVTSQAWSPIGNCWCTPTYSVADTAQKIANVKLANLNKNSASAGNPAPYYVDYTSDQLNGLLPIPIVYAGIPTNISVTNGSSADQYSGVWMDYNHNGQYDTTEYATTGANAGANGVSVITFVTPTVAPNLISTPNGITRMRIRGGETVQNTKFQPCGNTNSAKGEAEDYLVNILAPKPADPAVVSMNVPLGNCLSNCESITVAVQNYGSANILILSNPIKVFLKLNNTIVDSQIVTSPSTLSPFGGNTAFVTFPCVNMYAGGNYLINTSINIGNAGGVVNGYTSNDSLSLPISKINFRPVVTDSLEVCQNQAIGFGQGMTVTGCGNLVNDSIEIVFNVNPCIDNVGATNAGTSQIVPGAACDNIFACNFASGIIPSLPINNPNFSYGEYTVTNYTTSYPNEPRFILSSAANPTNFSNIYNPALLGYLITGNIYNLGTSTDIGTTSTFLPIRKYTRRINPATIGQIFAPNNANAGNPINVGYWESFNDFPLSTSDIVPNQGGGTKVTLKVYYSYVPTKINWYDNATSNTLLDTLAPYNPLSIYNVNPTAQLTNTSVAGTYTFFATCDGNNCRAPVKMIIHPLPTIIQDTLSKCEDAPGSNQAVFDLSQLSSSVGLGLPVTYFTDLPTLNQIQAPFLDTTSTVFRYAKVTANGCSSVDSVLLKVNALPNFPGGGTGLPQLYGNACAPSCLDVANLISFATVPSGSDTLYYENATCTVLHPNPHAVCTTDTVWIVLKSGTIPACTDTAVAYVDITPASNLIANQTVPFNYSSSGTVPSVVNPLNDGQYQMFYQTSDCSKVASVQDLPNGVSLGSTIVNQEISGSTLSHNGQPYVNRVYEIIPSVQDSAEICLLYLDDDINIYNQDAPGFGFNIPMTSANFTITQTHNGNVDSPNHTFTVIPPSAIQSSYDPTTTVWTLCFKVDSFSYFYLHTQNISNAALPINLLRFTGKRVENTSVLKWTTLSEQNNAYFEIEHSKDARNFTVVSDKLNSKANNGNSNTALEYSFTDMIPNEGHNYYRLKQTDRDGKTSKAKNVVDVYFGNETMVTMYPNPASSELNIDINLVKATNAKMKIMDATGRVVKQIDMNLTAGGNQTKVSLAGLTDGMYMVTITNDKGLNYSQTIRKN